MSKRRMSRREVLYVGSTVRLITVLIERIVLAGEDPAHVLADYAFEWGHGPDLAPLVKLIALRDGLRTFSEVYPSLWSMPAFGLLRRALKRAGGSRRRT